jgi:hypothetical protein
MTNESEVISAGRDAWSRVQDRARRSWPDWVLIGHAIQLGRAHALQVSGAKTPHGTKYTKAMAAFLAENGLSGIGQQVRWRLLSCMDHLADIEKWREGLPQEDRDRWSHPDSIWMHYCRDYAPDRRTEPRKITHSVVSAKRNSNGVVVNPGGDIIKRVAIALREGWSTDTFRLATIAIRAVLSDPDLPLLLNEAPPTQGHTRHTTVPDNAALTAA